MLKQGVYNAFVVIDTLPILLLIAIELAAKVKRVIPGDICSRISHKLRAIP